MKILVWSRWIDDIFWSRNSPDGIGGAEMQLAYWSYMLSDKYGYRVYTFGRRLKTSLRTKYNVSFLYLPWVRYAGVLWKDIMFLYQFLVRPDIVIIRDRDELVRYVRKRWRKSEKIVFMMASDAGLEDLSKGFLDSMKYVDLVVVQNDYQKKIISNMEGVRRILRLNSLFVPDLFLDVSNSSTKVYDFLFVGNLRRVKRPEWFLSAARMLTNHSFAYVGHCSDDYYRDKIGEMAQTSNFDYLGYLGMKEVLSIMKRSKVLVLTSINEGYPNVYLQAKYFGLSIVGTVDPNNELNNENGRYFVNKFEDLVGLMELALIDHDRELVREWGGSNEDVLSVFNRCISAL